jgi:flavorubredoxin
VYLLAGEASSLLVDAGAPFDLEVLDAQLESLLGSGLPPVNYLFPTHTETNHSSGLGRLLDRFPDAVVVGDPTDLHLNFPRHADRVSDHPAGRELELGARGFIWLPAIFRDLPSTRWGFDCGSRVLFSGDGLAFTHYHMAGHCGHTAEESMAAAESLDVQSMTRLFSEAAFCWTRFVDAEAYIRALDDLVEQLDVRVIAPAHGLPITEPRTHPCPYPGRDPHRSEADGRGPAMIERCAVVGTRDSGAHDTDQLAKASGERHA